MTTKNEAMKLALEGAANYIDTLGGDSRKYRQALAEQPAQQEPVYHLRQFGDVTKEQFDRYMATNDINQQPAQQEPVAWRYLTQYKNQSVWTYCAFEPTSRETWEALYTSPQQHKENT